RLLRVRGDDPHPRLRGRGRWRTCRRRTCRARGPRPRLDHRPVFHRRGGTYHEPRVRPPGHRRRSARLGYRSPRGETRMTGGGRGRERWGETVHEASLEDVGSGLAPATDGWFVVNARDAAWLGHPAFRARCVFEAGTPVLRRQPDLAVR